LPWRSGESDGNSAYADDMAVWVIAEDIEEAQRELQQLADAIAKFTRDNGLGLNGAKTQVMIGSAKAKARDISDITIHVDGAEVKPINTFELFGVTFDQRFTVRPYITTLSKAAKFLAGRVAGLAQYLPCRLLLRQLGSGLLMGKLAHCLLDMAQPRLSGSAKPIPEALASIQVAINNVARSISGYRREDHIPIEDLLELANLMSLNQLVVWATAMIAWNAHESDNGVAGSKNSVGNLSFNSGNALTARPTRATAAGEVRVPTRVMNTLVTHVLETWNACTELRNSKSKAKASRAATNLAKNSPL
jgi:uncharacterized membrane protein (UPF0136 family)